MTLSSHPIADQVYQITLSGLLTWDEFQTYLAQVESKAFASGKVRIFLHLKDFTGWESSDQWGDVSFFFRHDQDIERIAVVGDPHWQDEMQVFLFADYRQAETRFFAETDLELARAWLMS